MPHQESFAKLGRCLRSFVAIGRTFRAPGESLRGAFVAQSPASTTKETMSMSMATKKRKSSLLHRRRKKVILPRERQQQPSFVPWRSRRCRCLRRNEAFLERWAATNSTSRAKFDPRFPLQSVNLTNNRNFVSTNNHTTPRMTAQSALVVTDFPKVNNLGIIELLWWKRSCKHPCMRDAVVFASKMPGIATIQA